MADLEEPTSQPTTITATPPPSEPSSATTTTTTTTTNTHAVSASTTTNAPPIDTITLTIHHSNTPYTLTFPSTATLSDLSTHVTAHLSIPEPSQKYLITPKPGLLKPPFTTPNSPNASIQLAHLAATARKITLMGSSPAAIATLDAAVATAQKQNLSYRERAALGPVKPATPSKTRDWKTLHAETTYTFLTLQPLPHLPNPHRSLSFLERLRADPGIKAAMASHKWSVPLLTEMDPAEHTTHESRTLGLNRNRGEVIELRLRTDAYDGYRDYKTIRKTLCHELAHNVWGEHDARFWKLCREVEAEVERGDWRSGGRSVGGPGVEFYEGGGGSSGDEGMVADHGGWTGGEFVLGGGSSSAAESSSTAGGAVGRREILAKAAEERAKRLKDQQKQG